MPSPSPVQVPIRVIQFSRLIARQCGRSAPPIPEILVCDAIANGRRRFTGDFGRSGGAVVVFEKRLSPADRKRLPATLGTRFKVLGEVKREGCLALRVLAPRRSQKKSRDFPDF